MKEVVINGFNFKVEPGTREEIIINNLETVNRSFNISLRFKELINFCRYVTYADCLYRQYEHKEDAEAMNVTRALGDLIRNENILNFIDKLTAESYTLNG